MHQSHKKVFIIACIVAVGWLNALFAEKYELVDLISIAIQNSNGMQLEQIQQDITDQNYNSAIYDFLPNADYNLSAQDGTMGRQYNSSLSVSKNIYLNDPTYFNFKKTRLEKTNSKLEFEDKKKEIALNVFYLFIDILQTQKNINILNENFLLQKKIYEQINIQYLNDKKTIYDLQASQIDTLTAMTDLLELEKTLYSKRQDLFQMLNTEDLGYEFEDIELSNTDSIENDFTDNNAIKISENKLKQNKLNITSSQLSLYPNIYFGYAYRVGVTDKEANPIFKPKEYDDSYTYGVYFSYPLFSFLDKGSVHSVQKKQSKMLEINHKDLTSQQKVKYQQSINEFNIYKQSYEIYKQKLALSTTHLEIAQKRFEMGLINILDLDKSRIQYLEAQLSMNSKYYTLLKKQQELNYLKSNKILDRW